VVTPVVVHQVLVLASFRWLHSVTLTPYFWWQYFLFSHHLFTNSGRKTGAGFISTRWRHVLVRVYLFTYVAPPSHGLGKALDWGVRSLSEILSRQFPGGLRKNSRKRRPRKSCVLIEIWYWCRRYTKHFFCQWLWHLISCILNKPIIHRLDSDYSCQKPDSWRRHSRLPVTLLRGCFT
jgi:hypothetical protein